MRMLRYLSSLDLFAESAADRLLLDRLAAVLAKGGAAAVNVTTLLELWERHAGPAEGVAFDSDELEGGD